MQLDKLSGVSDWVLHDLRQTFSTKMAEWQIAEPHVVERIVNHITGSMSPLAKIYNRHVIARIGSHPVNRLHLLPWNMHRPATHSVAA